MGSSYAWQGNDKVGKGKMTIIEAKPDAAMTSKLEFIAPKETGGARYCFASLRPL